MRRLLDPRLWLALAAIGIVLTVVTHDAERPSPGPLNAAHARVPELAASDGCEQCHGDGGRELADACGACHAEIALQIEQRAGLHGALELTQATACGTCHPEHHGADARLVGERAFQRAGHDSRDAYDHREVADFDLHGAHTALACVDCHALADAHPLPADARRFLGAEQRCEACHEDPHGGRMAQACTTCHDQEHAFAELAAFRHTGDFPLAGPHDARACTECHAPDGAYAVEELAGASPPPARSCAACHESPHARAFEQVAGCEACHPVVDHGFGAAATLAVELHAATGFALDAPHAGLACADCHGAPGSSGSFADRYPGRTRDACAACHDDPHGGQFDDASGATDCSTCHAADAFHPSAFGVERHAATAFALEGVHAKADCGACHAPAVAEREPVRFRGTPAACADCHADPHAGALEGAESCGRCHVPTRFADVVPGSFDHGAHAGFALDGSHAAAACESCHPRAEHPDANGRSFGLAAERFGAPVDACSTCHADPHTDALEGAESCDRCHVPTRFADVTPGRFDHAADAGFPLRGAHAEARCESCHPRAEHPDANGRAFGLAAAHFGAPADACSTCHADPHDGAFDGRGLPAALHGREGCARCHDEHSFEGHLPGTFEHGRWTGFALDGAHARAACEACHARTDEPDTRGRSFGRARGSACIDCHGDPHVGQFADGGTTDCARCHATGPDFGVPDFDHAHFDHGGRTRFPLDATHAALDCGACHVDAPLAGGGSAVRYKPLGTKCQDCHGVGGTR